MSALEGRYNNHLQQNYYSAFSGTVQPNTPNSIATQLTTSITTLLLLPLLLNINQLPPLLDHLPLRAPNSLNDAPHRRP